MSTLRRLQRLSPVMHRFEEVLLEAASHRRERDEVVTGWGGLPECGWVAFERDQMRAAVDAERGRRHLPPVAPEAVARVEQMASGHCDYSKKYALYCAELAMGLEEIRP